MLRGNEPPPPPPGAAAAAPPEQTPIIVRAPRDLEKGESLTFEHAGRRRPSPDATETSSAREPSRCSHRCATRSSMRD